MKDNEGSPKRGRHEILVVCGVFYRTSVDGLEVAIFERKEPHVEFEFPGGKIDAGETDHQALQRELDEELAVEVTVGDLLGQVVYDYPTARINLKAYWVESTRTDFRLVDHHRWTWVNAKTWRTFKLAGPDIPLLEKIFSV